MHLKLEYNQSWGYDRDKDLFRARPPTLQLTQFDICNSFVDARNMLAILANSKQTLTSKFVFFVTLSGKTTWRKLLSSIGREYRHLTSFTLNRLQEERSGRALQFDSVIGKGLFDGIIKKRCEGG